MTDLELGRTDVAAMSAGPAASPPPSDRWLAGALFVLGTGTAAAALLGPLVGNVIVYHASPGAVNQIAGGDVAGLVLVAPVSVLAGALVLRRHRAGAVLALGPAAYAAYMHTQLALGGDAARYPGNSERFSVMFVGLAALGAAVAIRAWSTVDPDRLPRSRAQWERALAWFALAVAAFLTLGLHLPGLLALWRGQPLPEHLSDPVVFWLVKVMDLGLVVPALVAVGLGVLRGARWARKATYGASAWMAMLGTAVAGMAIVMQATGDPSASVGMTVAFGAVAATGLTIAAALHRPLLRRAARRRARSATADL